MDFELNDQIKTFAKLLPIPICIIDEYSNSVFTNTLMKPLLKEDKNAGHLLELSTCKIAELNDKYRLMCILEKDDVKDFFLATISHEIRTPLNGIIGMIELMEDTPLNNDQYEYNNIIKSCSLQLLSTINDILDFTKMKAGKITISESSFSLRDCLESCYDIVTPIAKDKNLELCYYISNDLPNYIVHDEKRIQQIIINLLTNAIKFTENGSIVTNVTGTQTENDGFVLTIKVTDTGIGIPDDRLHQIFDIFNSFNEKNLNCNGIGLGLSICKLLGDLLNASIYVETTKIDQGTTFVFELKDIRIDENKHMLDYNQDLLKNKKALVVDDNKTNRIIFSNMLISLNMIPLVCGSGDEALSYFKSNQNYYDIIFIDIVMPKMNGIELAEKLKDCGCTIPMIALSSIGDSIKDLGNNFTHKFTKPVKMSQLSKTCIKIFGGKFDDTSCITNPCNNIHEHVNILVAEDVINNQKVISGILKNLGFPTVDIVSNGFAAVKATESKKYDIILMDIKMPIMDGYQASKEIKKSCKKNDIKKPYILAVTATTIEFDIQNMYDHGIDAYILKPFRKMEMETKLNIILDIINSEK